MVYNFLPITLLLITSQLASSNIKDLGSELKVAVFNNDLKWVEYFLNLDAKKLRIEEREWEVACMAAMTGNLNIIQHIVKRNKEIIQKKNEGNYTLGHIAAEYGHPNIVEYWINGTRLCRSPHKNIHLQSICHIAAKKGHLNVIQFVHKNFKYEMYKWAQSIGKLAAENGHLDIVCYMIKLKSAVYCTDFENIIKIAIKNSQRSDNRTLELCLELAEKLEEKYYCPNMMDIAHNLNNKNIIQYIVREKPLMVMHKKWKESIWTSHNIKTTAFHYAVQKNLVDMDTVKYVVEKKKIPLTKTDSYDNETVGHTAAYEGRIEILLYLIKKEPSILKIADYLGNTILHIILGKYNLSKDIFEFFVENGAPLTQRNAAGKTVGHIAAYHGDLVSFKFIVEKEPSILTIKENKPILHIIAEKAEMTLKDLIFFAKKEACLTEKTSYYHRTVAHILATKGNTELVEYLVEKEPTILTMADYLGDTVLHQLAKKNALNRKSLQFFVQKSASLMMNNNENNNIIKIEAQNGNIENLKYLVKLFAGNITCLAEISKTAANHGYSNVLKLIAETAPDFLAEEPTILFKLPNSSEVLDTLKYLKAMCKKKIQNWNMQHFEDEVLRQATEYDYPNILQYMKYDVNMIYKNREPLIFTAIRYKRPNIFYYLATDGKANLTALDGEGNNILFIAAEYRDLEKIKYILDTLRVPIDIEWRNNKGDVLLHVAVYEALTKNDIRAQNNLKNYFQKSKSSEEDRYTPYNSQEESQASKSLDKSYKQHQNNISVIEYLVEQKHANINARGYQNKTVLHYASSRGNYHIVNYLFDHGADPKLRDQKGHNIWQVAQFPSFPKSVDSK